MIALVRRLWLFMGVSALLNFAALALLGELWRPLPDGPPLPAPKMLLLTLLPPAATVKPPLRPKPKPPAPKRQPRARATPLPPAPHHTHRVAPAASGGGSPTSRPSAKPQDASKFNTLAVNATNAALSQFLKTLVTAHPVQTHADNGHAPSVTKPGKTDKPETIKTVSTLPGDHSGTTQGGGQKGTPPGTGDGTGSGPGAGGPGPFGITGKGGGGDGPRHVVYLLDISGSMGMTEAKFHGEKRIDKAREELKAQLASLSPDESFSIIVFSSEVRSFRQELISPTQDTVQEANQFLDKLEPEEATDLERALKTALAVPDVNLIYVITDGVPWPHDGDKYGPKDFPALAERIRVANVNRISIYTIGLLGPNPDGTDDSTEASKFLTEIANDNGGKFVEVKLDGEGQ